MATAKSILLLAAENDALPGGKVGGIGDFVRDLPRAMAERGWRTQVLTPAYGRVGLLPGAERRSSIRVNFGGGLHELDLYRWPDPSDPRVSHLVLDHPLFGTAPDASVYNDDPPDRPFATDATRFALFNLAAAELLARGVLAEPRCVHLNDWHCGLFLALREYHPGFAKLRRMRCVFTIHNLALQGVRPLKGDPSSLEAWFPGMPYDLHQLRDRRWSNCVNPMRLGIVLAERVHTVSPSYAREILQPSSVEDHGFYGGEGLEGDLSAAQAEGRLFGILNGCDYSRPVPETDWPSLLAQMRHHVLRSAADSALVSSADFLAASRLAELSRRRPSVLLTAVSRVVEQKVRLFRESDGGGHPSLDGLLDALGEDGLFVLLGSGAEKEERFLRRTAARRRNFVFLRGYAPALSEALFAAGDLFLMPSLYEPCGIAQMLAMRAGQPCLVHGVGGLRDTVEDGVTGFVFGGDGFSGMSEAFVTRLRQALKIMRERPQDWQLMRERAAGVRFSWQESATAFERDLYDHSDG